MSWIRLMIIVFWTSKPHFVYLVHSRAGLQSNTVLKITSKCWRLDPVCLWHNASDLDKKNMSIHQHVIKSSYNHKHYNSYYSVHQFIYFLRTITVKPHSSICSLSPWAWPQAIFIGNKRKMKPKNWVNQIPFRAIILGKLTWILIHSVS